MSPHNRGLLPLLLLASCYWIPEAADDTNAPDDSEAPEASPWYADGDGDGYGRAEDSVQATTQPEGYVAVAGDCDDTDPQTYPDAAEVCDGHDNNCDTLVDDDDPQRQGGGLWVPDADEDGHGDATAEAVQACDAPVGRVLDGEDCDDARADVSPSADEAGCDLLDQDCDGMDWPLSAAPIGSDWSAAYNDLGDALASAGSGELLCLAPGVYDAVDLDLGEHELALIGAACAAVDPDEDCEALTVLDAGGAGRVLSIRGGQSASTWLFGFTVTGGRAELGGGLYIEGSAPTLERLVLSANHADTAGGGLYAVTSDDLTLLDLHVRDNTATGQGAGVAVTTSGDLAAPTTAQVTLSGCVFQGNLATLDHSGRVVGGAAGAVWAAGDDTLNIEVNDCVVEDNHFQPGTSAASSAPTGGLRLAGAAVTVKDSALTGNTSQSGLAGSNSEGAGGALFVEATAGATLAGLTFEENSDVSSGGALALGPGSGASTLSDSTFTGNRAGHFASALGAASSLEITGVTFTANEVVTVAATEGGAVTLKILSGDAGLVYSLSHVEFTGNTSVNQAGALYGYNLKEITIQDSRFTDNLSDRSGGAVFIGGKDTTITLARLEFTGNQAGEGGGALATNVGGALHLSDSELSNNTATGGGALALNALTEVEILGCSFLSNTAANGGAVVFGGATTAAQTVTLTQSSFVMNDGGTGNGGAITADSSYAVAPIVVNGENLILLGNTADHGGAVAVLSNSTLNLVNAAVVANAATQEGGGIWVNGDANGLTLQNTTFVSNSTIGAVGPALYVYTSEGPEVVIQYSHAANNTNGSNSEQLGGSYTDTDFVADGNLLAGDPLFTSTSAADMSAWILTLQSGSPLIDVGDPTLSDPDGSRSDIGAYGGPGGSW